jgi:hypothetical protein
MVEPAALLAGLYFKNFFIPVFSSIRLAVFLASSLTGVAIFL